MALTQIVFRLRKRQVRVLALVVAVAIWQPGLSEENSRLRNWFSAAEVIWSYDGQSKLSAVGAGGAFEINRRQRYLRGLWRCDDFAGSQIAFNGQKVTKFSPEQGFASHAVSNQALTALRFSIAVMPHEASHSVFYGQAYSEILGVRLDGVVWRSETTAFFPPTHQAKKLVPLLTNAVLVEFQRLDVPFPTRIAVLSRDNEQVLFETISEFEKNGDLWFPINVERRTYLDGKVSNTYKLTTELNCVNCNIAPEVFDLLVPEGTVQYDEREDRNYVRTSKSEKDYQAYADWVRSTATDSNSQSNDNKVFWARLLTLVLSSAAICFLLILRIFKSKGG